MGIAIKVENLSKAYQLGEIGTGTISRDLERYLAKLRGKEDPFLKVGESNDRTKKGDSDIVWSLKDLNFEIEQGDAVGIIGRNGAGKSTLLKILSRVTSPTTGSVKIKGRVASLLEVGTGFHPELTGRENIFLNGAILGMRKSEIKKHFDAIVDFAGIERYVDTPVKRYSSGMYVRLAFAVAAHLESEILVVDEVLAVGDAEFQKKCLGKMNDVSKGEGRTVLFVSHNLAFVRNLCNKGISLTNGELSLYTETSIVINDYLNNTEQANTNIGFRKIKRANSEFGKELLFKNCIIVSQMNDSTFLYGEEMNFIIKLHSQYLVKQVNIGIRIEDETGYPLIGPRSMDVNASFDINSNSDIKVNLAELRLVPGKYYVTLTAIHRGVCLDQIEKCLSFEVRNETFGSIKPFSGAWGKIMVQPKWTQIA